ncbi:MAG TPA: Asp-tRNA(Asn)/Glu-tRNA(Gln) amidotransferase subunit GatC, partial [Candidatus Saccharimonadales bacterium]|nr:Asp-tRNA(Asn)/Glu-tRNA(Gln) amidotransferase subunit GatC [Candidatus Saccharimonadales bacterium]
RLAALARIQLTDQEIEKLSVDMPKIVDFVEELQGAEGLSEVELKAVPAASLREDEVSSGRLTDEDFTKLAPNWENNQLKVPPVFE